ncbi:cold-shock protein [Curtobacterium sp. MCBD17_019]|uniref:cold-shock protein n=1 Tax=Curtobacterium sp. MCBD17_019 TaxID=2175669 RepID=UPI000DA6FC29|nr:cold-shock protein [Curtobacterium sp. MCBD17_019]PZE73425.1 cold-shock protein [Curtobacterium sp. MCBD17_019]
MPTGTVKWFDNTKGYGFITPDDGTDDVFAHFSSIVPASGERVLNDHERVQYDLGPGKKGRNKGPQAENIRPLR